MREDKSWYRQAIKAARDDSEKRISRGNERSGTNRVPVVFDTSRQTRDEAEAERRRKGVDKDEANSNSNRNMRIVGFSPFGLRLVYSRTFFFEQS